MTFPVLHISTVQADEDVSDRIALFLHGILGRGANLRPLAQAWVRADPRYRAVLVDLRMHGRSQGFPPPHTLRACAGDLRELSATLAAPVRAVVGHSFGGKVALAFHELTPDLERVALLDSTPSARPSRRGSEDTLAVLDMLGRMPSEFARREDFVARVEAEGHARAIAEWLAMNLERAEHGFRLRVDLGAIRALIDDYFAADLWSVLERSGARIDVVVGGKSRVFDEQDEARLRAIEANAGGRVRMHVLEHAGHWVHVDDPRGVERALFPQTGAPFRDPPE